MNIVLGSVGPVDDLYAMMALGDELKKRGHWVMICAPEEFRSISYKNDFKMFSCGASYKQFLMPSRAEEDPCSGLADRLARDVAEHFVSMRDALREAEILVGSSLPLAGPSVAEQFGVKYCYVMFHPYQANRDLYPWFGIPQQKASGWMGSMRRGKWKKEWNDKVLAALNRERKFSGLPPIQDLTSHLLGKDPILAADPVLLNNSSENGTGFLFEDGEIELAPEFETFLNSGKPPVYLGDLGIPQESRAAFVASLLGELNQKRHRLLLSEDWPEAAGVFRCESRQLESFFHRLSCVVHSGSHRVISCALRAGIPQVVAPYLADQLDSARRLQFAGVSAAPALLAEPAVIAESVHGTLSNSNVLESCRKAAETVRSRNGVHQVSGRLEQWIED